MAVRRVLITAAIAAATAAHVLPSRIAAEFVDEFAVSANDDVFSPVPPFRVTGSEYGSPKRLQPSPIVDPREIEAEDLAHDALRHRRDVDNAPPIMMGERTGEKNSHPIALHDSIALASRAVVAAAAPLPVVNRTLCTLTESATIHVKFATEYYASKFPGINWGFKWVGGTWWPSERQAARWWAINGNTQCDGLIGPGWSSAAIAMSPLVDTAWIDPSATATELSDKSKHARFSRDIPTDAVAASLVAEVMSSLGWSRSNVFCVDDTYGRSLFNGFKGAWDSRNNTLDTALCLPSDAANSTIDSAVDQFVRSPTRTTYLIFRADEPTARRFVERLQPHAQTLNLFYSEALCDSSLILPLRSGLCLSYYNNMTAINDYLTAYRAKNFSSDIEVLKGLGGTAAQIGPLNNIENGYSMFLHDAAHHMMKSMHLHHTTNSSAKLYAYLRTVVSQGATGTVRFDTRGDRVAVDAQVINFLSNSNKTRLVGYVKDGKYDPVNGSETLYEFLGQGPSTVVPSDTKPVTPVSSSSSDATRNTIIAVGCSVLFLIVCSVALWYLFCRPKTRDNSAAPKDARKPFAMVFTDIQASTTLWARAPESMGDALDMHHAVIRELVVKHKGYEVKTIGDAFMVAFKHADAALRFATDIQHALYDAPWSASESIDATYEELVHEMLPDLKPLSSAAYDALWRGLRVRVGVHYGTGDIKEDQTTLGFDYYGTVVNTAARVESVGHGGQVLVTADAYDAITDAGRNALDSKLYSVTHMGPQPLRGLSDPVTLFQVLPTRFATRSFPPLRLDAEVDDTDAAPLSGDALGSSASGSVAGGSTTSITQSSTNDIASVAQWLAKKLPKSSGVDGATLSGLFDVHKTLLAATKPAFRSSTVKTLAERWRVQSLAVPSKLKSAAAGITSDDMRLLVVLARAAAATETSKNLNSHHRKGTHASPSRSASEEAIRGPLFNGGAESGKAAADTEVSELLGSPHSGRGSFSTLPIPVYSDIDQS